MNELHTHSPLPPPLRSAMKHSPSTPTSPATSPSTSPFISRIPLPTTSPASSLCPLPGPPHSPSPTPNAPAPADPPATPGYTPKVSFDTFENPAASMFSLTLQVKSEGYARTRNTRVFLCASSPDESGVEALDWALESLVQDGDELIVFRGLDEEVLEKEDHNTLRNSARAFLVSILQKSHQLSPDSRRLSIILEYVPGKVTDTLDRLIALYRPDSVVVGTRGRRAWQNMGMGMSMSMGIGMGSVSKYCLTHSPVPIIVVRPERKVKKAVEKRRADPKRGRHFGDA